MPLPSFFKRNNPPADRRRAPPADEGGAVEAARLRARRRLIGAVVLLAIGVIGFPLVFETQPRPLAVDIPIEAPKKDGPALTTTHPRVVPNKASAPLLAEVPLEFAPEAAPPTPVPAAVPSAPAPAPAPAPAAAAAARPPASTSAKTDDGSRAKALLEDGPASQARAGRFVVQVGAYTDAAALREARQKVEKLGLKTYTQVIETEAGKRTRVRVGPFATREEADSAGAKLKSAGLPTAILTL